MHSQRQSLIFIALDMGQPKMCEKKLFALGNKIALKILSKIENIKFWNAHKIFFSSSLKKE